MYVPSKEVLFLAWRGAQYLLLLFADTSYLYDPCGSKGQRATDLGFEVLHHLVGIGPLGKNLLLFVRAPGGCDFVNEVVIDGPDQRLALLVPATGSKGEEDRGRSRPASLPGRTATKTIPPQNDGFVEHAMVGIGTARVAEVGVRLGVTDDLDHGLGHDARGIGGNVVVLVDLLGGGGERGGGGRGMAELAERCLGLAQAGKRVERRDALDSRARGGDHLDDRCAQ